MIYRFKLVAGFFAGLLAVALLPGAAAPALTPCSPAGSLLAPRLLSPCDQAVVHAGRRFTFEVRDLNSHARRYPPYLNVTKAGPRRGVLRDATGIHGSFSETHAVAGYPGLYAVRALLFKYPGYWLLTPGTYYLQLQQIDPAADSGIRYGPVETITVVR